MLRNPSGICARKIGHGGRRRWFGRGRQVGRGHQVDQQFGQIYHGRRGAGGAVAQFPLLFGGGIDLGLGSQHIGLGRLVVGPR